MYEFEEYGDYGEVYQDYGETYQDSEEENPQVNLSDVDAYKREEDSYGRGRDDRTQRDEIEETYVAPSIDDAVLNPGFYHCVWFEILQKLSS